MQNFIKTIINGVQKWTKKEIKKSTADWNQNDENAADYVKDRTHWEEKKRVTLVDNLTFADYDSGNAPKCNFVPGQKYDVIWNGVLYEGLVCWFDGEYNIIASSDNGCPFYIDDDGGDDLYISSDDDDNNWVVSIIEDAVVIHKLDSKYLDLPTNLATTDDVQEAVDVANAAQNAAETALANAATAQSTAETAQSTAETAQATAETNSSRFLECAGLPIAFAEGGMTHDAVYGNDKFIFLGANERYNYSKDGIIWKKSYLPFGGTKKSITYGGGKFVLVCINASSADALSYYSEDGVNWTKISGLSGFFVPSGSPVLSYCNGKFIATLGYSNNCIYSEDGITWARTWLPCADEWNSIVYGNGKFVISSNNKIYYSEDCIVWLEGVNPVSNHKIYFYNGRFIISSNNEIYYSEDCIVWTKTESLSPGFLQSITYGNGVFVAVIANRIYYSEDCITWVKTNSDSSIACYGVTYGNGKFVSSIRNRVIYSEDGINWYKTYDIIAQNNENVTGKVRDLILPISSTATVGQTIAVKAVDEDGKPTKWETTNISTSGGSGCVVSDTAPEDTSVLWIDTGDNSSDENLGGGNVDLGVTGATVGQTVKISAVDENGVPTAWESVDFPSGAGWRLIADITLEEEVKSVDISTDMDGNPFALGAYYLIAKTVPAVNTEDRFTYVKINTNGVASMNNIIYDTTAKNTIYLSDFCILVGNVNPIHFAGAYDTPYNWGYSIMSMSPYHMSVKMDSIKKITICPNDYSKVFGGAGTEIKLYGIDI